MVSEVPAGELYHASFDQPLASEAVKRFRAARDSLDPVSHARIVEQIRQTRLRFGQKRCRALGFDDRQFAFSLQRAFSLDATRFGTKLRYEFPARGILKSPEFIGGEACETNEQQRACVISSSTPACIPGLLLPRKTKGSSSNWLSVPKSSA